MSDYQNTTPGFCFLIDAEDKIFEIFVNEVYAGIVFGLGFFRQLYDNIPEY